MQDGKLHFIAGRSRVGKTWYVSRLTKKSKRLLIYDPKGKPSDYPGCHVIDSPTVLIETLKKAGKGAGRYRFIDQGKKYFGWWCRVAYAWGKIQTCDVVADELAAVTSPAKAPGGWHELLSQALGFGINIFAITQRPAESDKTAISNCTLMTAFHSQRRADRQYMADEMDIDRRLIDELKPLQGITVRPGESPEVFSLQ